MKRTLLLFYFCFHFILCNSQPCSWFSSSTIDTCNPQPGQYAIIRGFYSECDDQMKLRPSNREVLDSVSIFIDSFKLCIFQIEKHTDCRADSLYNLDISQRYADSIVAYIERKIHSKRVKAVGKGESEPLNDCRCEGAFVSRPCTEEEHQQNRRVVLRVLKQ